MYSTRIYWKTNTFYLFFNRVCLSLSVFIRGTLSSLLKVLLRGHCRSAGEGDIKTQTYTFSVCLWIWHWYACYKCSAVACIRCLVVPVMYDLHGGCISTQAKGVHIIYLYSCAEGVWSVSPLHWLTEEVTDRAPARGVFLLMADVVLWYGLNFAHMLPERKHIFYPDVVCACLIPHAEGYVQPHLEILLFFCAPHLYTCEVHVEYFAKICPDLLFYFIYMTDVTSLTYWNTLTTVRTDLNVILANFVWLTKY